MITENIYINAGVLCAVWRTLWTLSLAETCDVHFAATYLAIPMKVSCVILKNTNAPNLYFKTLWLTPCL